MCPSVGLPINSLFVLNDWHQLQTGTMSMEEEEKYIRRIQEEIASFSRGFLPEDLLVISAEKALFSLKSDRKITDQLKTFCKAVARSFPRWHELFFLHKVWYGFPVNTFALHFFIRLFLGTYGSSSRVIKPPLMMR